MARPSVFAKFLDTHYTWEDWLGIALGAAIILSPMASAQPITDTALVSAMLTGVLVAALSALELVDLRRFEEWLLLLLGAWLAASPSLFGYATDLALSRWHTVLGLAVMVLAGFQFWQDRNRKDDELARHGR